jgi:predicted nucleic acid-binding protein
MKSDYIWDTNTAIYYLQNQFSADAEKLVDNIVIEHQTAISVITEIELLSWKLSTETDIEVLNKFISKCLIYPLDNDVKLQTIRIRKEFKLKLPDAIIAATALAKGKILISRNISDFTRISGLKILNPFNGTTLLI